MPPSSTHMARHLSLGVLVLQNSLFVILMRYARSSGSTYSAACAVLLQEVMKFVFCVILSYGRSGLIDEIFHFKTITRLSVQPAFCPLSDVSSSTQRQA